MTTTTRIDRITDYKHNLYGDDGIRAGTTWAAAFGYVLLDGIADCAHGAYLMVGCPDDLHCPRVALDHARWWAPAELDDGSPFLLAHSYQTPTEITADLAPYARAHGLELQVGEDGQAGWYGAGTTPVRLTIPENITPWPLELELWPELYARTYAVTT